MPLALALLIGCPSKPPTDSDPAVPVTPEDFAAAVDGARYQADLEALAVPRPPGTPGWQAAQDLCATRLEAFGYTVTRASYGTGTNVVGRKAGTASEGAVVLSAHYDSVPECPGADDNASGVAGALEAARVLALGSFTHDVVVACWDEEERGLIGSQAYVAALPAGEHVRMMWSFEMIGYTSSEPDSQTLPAGFDLIFPDQVAAVEANDNRGDFIAYVGVTTASAAQTAFEAHATAVGLPYQSIVLTPAQSNNFLFADLQRSDHASFWAAGHPAAMLTDTANFRNGAYHCDEGPDTVDRLDQAFATNVIRAAVGASATLLGP